MRSIFRNTALSSLQGVSLAASFALSCEKYPRKLLVYFLSGISITDKKYHTEHDHDAEQRKGIHGMKDMAEANEEGRRRTLSPLFIKEKMQYSTMFVKYCILFFQLSIKS